MTACVGYGHRCVVDWRCTDRLICTTHAARCTCTDRLRVCHLPSLLVLMRVVIASFGVLTAYVVMRCIHALNLSHRQMLWCSQNHTCCSQRSTITQICNAHSYGAGMARLIKRCAIHHARECACVGSCRQACLERFCKQIHTIHNASKRQMYRGKH